MNKVKISKIVMKRSTETAMLLATCFLVWGAMQNSPVWVGAIGLIAFTAALLVVKYINARYMKRHLQKCGFLRVQIPTMWDLLTNEETQKAVSKIMSYPTATVMKYREHLVYGMTQKPLILLSRLVPYAVANALGHLREDMPEEFCDKYLYYVYLTVYRHEDNLSDAQQLFMFEFMREYAAQLAEMIADRK